MYRETENEISTSFQRNGQSVAHGSSQKISWCLIYWWSRKTAVKCDPEPEQIFVDTILTVGVTNILIMIRSLHHTHIINDILWLCVHLSFSSFSYPLVVLKPAWIAPPSVLKMSKNGVLQYSLIQICWIRIFEKKTYKIFSSFLPSSLLSFPPLLQLSPFNHITRTKTIGVRWKRERMKKNSISKNSGLREQSKYSNILAPSFFFKWKIR